MDNINCFYLLLSHYYESRIGEIEEKQEATNKRGISSWFAQGDKKIIVSRLRGYKYLTHNFLERLCKSVSLTSKFLFYKG